MDAGWSDRLDQLLRSNVEADRNGVNKNKIKWESVAKMIPGMSADQCQARWTVLHTLPGLENKGISLLPNPHSARFGARRPGPPRPPSGMTPPPSRDAFAAGSRPGSALSTGSRPGSRSLAALLNAATLDEQHSARELPPMT